MVAGIERWVPLTASQASLGSTAGSSEMPMMPLLQGGAKNLQDIITLFQDMDTDNASNLQ